MRALARELAKMENAKNMGNKLGGNLVINAHANSNDAIMIARVINAGACQYIGTHWIGLDVAKACGADTGATQNVHAGYNGW